MGSDSPLKILSTLDRAQRAGDFGFLPLTEGVESTRAQLAQARNEVLPGIWNREIREHFDYIFRELQTALGLRSKQGFVSPLAAAYIGCPFLYLDEAHQFLLEPYEPKRSVREWFRFRNESVFTPDSRTRKLQHLRAQFGLASWIINCECGVMIEAAVPKWREHHEVRCAHCQRVHRVLSKDMRRIAVPEDEEES